MKRVRIGIIGTGSPVEAAILPILSGPDAVSPPDTGAWWSRRGDNPDIAFQPPARPEVVAIAEAGSTRGERGRAENIARSWRVRASYADWRSMLREAEVDALLCVASPTTATEVIGACGSKIPVWVLGPPAASLQELQRLQESLRGRDAGLWCAAPLRQASAHRTACQLVERGEIGAVTALNLRWATPFDSGESGDESRFAATYAAVDWLRFLAQSAPSSVASSVCSDDDFAPTAAAGAMAHYQSGATHIWLRFSSGVSATALFSAAETWSSPLPRLEICGTQGRWLTCEAGRRFALYHPREATRLWEPPGLAPQISSGNVAGVAEDLKAFLAFCADEARSQRTGGQTGLDALRSSEHTLHWIDTIAASLAMRDFAPLMPLFGGPGAPTSFDSDMPPRDTLTLSLPL